MPDHVDRQIEIGGQTYTVTTASVPIRLIEDGEMPPEVAKASHDVESQMYFQDGVNPDLCHVQFVLDSEGANANWDYMPREQLVRSYATLRFKPFDMDHVIKEQSSMTFMSKDAPPVKNTIYGVMTAARLADAEGNLLTDAQIKSLDLTDDPNRAPEDRVTVVAWAALYNFLFPKTVASVIEKMKAGEMSVSMERWVHQYDYTVWDGEQYRTVTRADAEASGLADRWKARQMENGHPINRRTLKFVYGGAASTQTPANKMARFLAPNVVRAAASMDSDALLKSLLQRHSEIHDEFVVSPPEQQPRLIAEHERVTRAVAALVGAKS